MSTVAEDRDEILQLLYRYNHTIDAGDAEGWADTWTDDGVFDAGGSVLRGRAELVGFASGVSGVRHVVMNPLVDVTGDRARVRAYLMLLVGGAIGMIGVYDDEVVRTPSGWRFAARTFTPDASA
ncbi:MAG TPA: nuclear transport factor 2 family protein, partial [Acidimicrobiia bacterium]|nr:nuclear transport factor 2 family protein [Acidimicrobiia bacterium]